MTTEMMADFEFALRAREQELAAALNGRDRIAVESAPDEIEQLGIAEQRDLAVAQLNETSRLLREVRAALARCRAGAYGECEECGEEIPIKRLQAVPWAACCVRCQQRREAERDTADARRNLASMFLIAA